MGELTASVADEAKRKSSQRRLIQSLLWVIVVITILGGYWFPLLGFTVPVVMVAGLVGGLLKGRFVCGWLCPRGAFFDRVMTPISSRRGIPDFLRNGLFRWTMLVLLMGFMALQIAQNPGDVYHWGRVFWRICVLTTAIGVVLALVLHPRSWCSFCPMGTLQRAAGGEKSPRYLEEGCKGCRACERACPMNLSIIGDKQPGRLHLPDCLKCPECQVACPQQALHF